MARARSDDRKKGRQGIFDYLDVKFAYVALPRARAARHQSASGEADEAAAWYSPCPPVTPGALRVARGLSVSGSALFAAHAGVPPSRRRTSSWPALMEGVARERALVQPPSMSVTTMSEAGPDPACSMTACRSPALGGVKTSTPGSYPLSRSDRSSRSRN
jgi:hypothetical protein